jgi:hypothetical protein
LARWYNSAKTKQRLVREKKAKLITKADAPNTLLSLLATMSPLEEDFPVIEDFPPEPVDLDQPIDDPAYSGAIPTQR